jgi:2'-5' RNA ligase
VQNLCFPLYSAFIAVPLEGEAQKRYTEVQRRLEPWQEILTFQNPRTAHLTLMFWREMMEIEYHDVCRMAKVIAERVAPFAIEVTGVETFGNHGNDAVLFLSVNFSPALASLKKCCPWSDGKPFCPHITLARIAHPQRFRVAKKEIMKTLRGTAFTIECSGIRLYAKVHGASQTTLRDFVFSLQENV